MERYDHTKVEKKWQKNWEESHAFAARDDSEKPKYYVLDMFPYPSGAGLHVGHVEGYTATDIYSRYKRANGFNVLHPIGWDAFGLPAENYAIKTGTPPRKTTDESIANFKRQIKNLGLSYDWDREFGTHNPDYYRWTQWLFTKFFEKGLVYKKKALVNWDPVDQTVLANEQVLPDGTAERSGAKVEKKELEQWFYKITDYADELIDGLTQVDWPESTKINQRNWIGKSEGAEIDFAVAGTDEKIKVFTTRPDTLFGATYMVLAPEHPLVQKFMESASNKKEIAEYVTQAKSKSDIDRSSEGKEKTGVELKGVKAINPATKKEIPIFIADYVLATYGTGAIMAVPAHDERDFEFARDVVSKTEAPKYLIFDFDGVIGNTFEHSVATQVIMADGNGPYPVTNAEDAKESVLRYARNKPKHTRDHALTPDQLQSVGNWTKRFGEEMSKRDIELFDAFIEEIVKISNTKIAIVSSGSKTYIEPLIKKSTITPTHVLTYEDHHSKEEKIEKIVKDWGAKLEDIYYFTDTKADVYELEKFLPKSHLIGCAWGYLGKEELEEVLPREQILENFSDIHYIFEPLVRQVVAPVFVLEGPSAPREGKEYSKRVVTSAIIHNPKDNTYLTLKWPNGETGLVGGGIEKGETAEMAIIREVKEETGYTNFIVSKQGFPIFYGHGYKTRKDINCFDFESYFIVDLVTDTQEALSAEDVGAHEIIWVKEEDVEKSLSLNHHRDLWNYYKNNIETYSGSGTLINSGKFDGMSSEEAKKKITESVGGKMKTTYRLRDWLISRQRYWGAPIPIVYDPEGKAHAVPEEHLPWLLPEDVEYLPKGTSPLGTSKELLERTERLFGKGWKPEIDTMDTFACSSWYFFRFADPHDEKEFASKEMLKKWLPVDLYVGGAEHTVLHLLYARFFTKALRDMGYLTFDEPFLKLRHQGLILAEDSRKMSKRWGNVINPDDMVERFGADSVRMYEMFMGPLEASKPWNTASVMGVRRFLERVWNMFEKVTDVPMQPETESLSHLTIKKVSDDIESLKMNTAVSSLMIFLNHLSELEQIPKAAYGPFLKLLAPFAPHLTHELAQKAGYPDGAIETWPVFDAAKVVSSMAKVAIQVNGKLRATLSMPVDISQEDAVALAKADAGIAKWLAEGEVIKLIYVPGKIINFVVHKT